jgi:hypothetical protein
LGEEFADFGRGGEIAAMSMETVVEGEDRGDWGFDIAFHGRARGRCSCVCAGHFEFLIFEVMLKLFCLGVKSIAVFFLSFSPYMILDIYQNLQESGIYASEK